MLLDISRFIYTLRTSNIIAKTKAGEWALAQKLCPVQDALEKTLQVRNEPMKYKNDPDIKHWLCTLGPSIQKFANIIEKEIDQTK